jgi:hypothetical protein
MEQTTPGLPAQQAVERLRAFAESWREADVPEARVDLMHAIYEKVVVAGRSFVSARLIPAACQHGLARVLPESVMARPEGFEHTPPTFAAGVPTVRGSRQAPSRRVPPAASRAVPSAEPATSR